MWERKIPNIRKNRDATKLSNGKGNLINEKQLTNAELAQVEENF